MSLPRPNIDYVDQNDYPYEIKDVESTINEELLKDFSGEYTGFIQVGDKKWFFPYKCKNYLETFYNFKVRPTDVWIVTFPKSGTTVTQELIWLLLNNLDYEKSSRIPLVERYPFMEVTCLFHPKLHTQLLKENEYSQEKYKNVQKLAESTCIYLDQMKERRFIKTHLPLSLLPKNLLTSGCKVIYIARNPKDLAVSYYHHSRLIRIHGFQKDFQKFWDYFSKNLVIWAPYWEHVFEAWEKKSEENLLFLFYENISKDLKKTISDVQNFLGTNFTDEQLSVLHDHLKIENFRKNKSVNFDVWETVGLFNENEEPFIRKGKNGEAIKYFDVKLENEANDWIEQQLKNTNLKFPKF